MAALNARAPQTQRPIENIVPEKAVRVRRHRKPKSKGREAGDQILAEGPAQASTSGGAEQLKPWPWVAITESSATKHPAIFTKDGSYFFSIVGSSVKIHAASTGVVVSTLSAARDAGSHTAAITSVLLNPHNVYQLITGSFDGHVKIWDFLDGALLQTINVEHPVRHLTAHEQWKDFLFASVARPSKRRKGNGDDDNGVILRISLKASPATSSLPVQAPLESVLVGKTRTTRGLAISPSGSWLVAIGGHKAYVAPTANLKAGFTKFVSPEALTCLAFHPTEEYFATGDEKGTIRLWYCLHEAIAPAADVEKRAPTTTLHWHAHAVSALAFTPNGAYLLSGGEESVLVIWQVHSGKREFVPRVGAPIYTVTVSRTSSGEEEYLLGLADASITFISAAKLTISRSYSRIKLDPAISHSRHALVPLAVHSLSSTLVLPSSHPSSLQTYSPSSSKLISELEVSPSNRVSRRDEKMLEPSRVEKAVVSSTGEWLATLDSREGDESFRGEVYLKIWRWEGSAGLWVLNTRIDRPHGTTKVNSVVFSPGSSNNTLLVTSGDDGNVKSWRIRAVVDKKAGTADVFWVARSSFNFKQEVPATVSWSSDGSLLAVAFGVYVNIYDPSTNALLQSLTTPELRNRAASVHFLGNGGRYLAVVGLSDIVLWDLVVQKVHWHHRSAHQINAVVSHPRTESFAIFYSQPTSGVSIFDSSSNAPRDTFSLPFALRNVVWYPQPSAKAKETSAYNLVGITDNWDVVLCGDDVRPPVEEGSSARGLATGSQEPHKRTLFQDIFGDSALSGAPSDTVTWKAAGATKPWDGKDITNILSGPAYLMPPLEMLFDTFMDSFLTPRQPESDSRLAPIGVVGEEDVTMDVDEETQERPPATGARPERIVGTQEMDALVDLFRRHAVKGENSPLSARPAQSNGAAPDVRPGSQRSQNGHSLGARKSKVNGTPRAHTDTPSRRPLPPSSPAPNMPNSSPAVVGKKRKTPAAS
ncbi:quinon protein alcohol dehydrogenase-like superfamily [Gloeopeniophorella convolvens]|nr:quinon protein alcohol dehydrogenase-like superfamily [Gloeopeniophorella convolvens]